MIVGRLLCFWDGVFSGAMLNFGRVTQLSDSLLQLQIQRDRIIMTSHSQQLAFHHLGLAEKEGSRYTVQAREKTYLSLSLSIYIYIWLVVEPTHLKNMSQNGNIPQNRDEHQKYLKPPRWFNSWPFDTLDRWKSPTTSERSRFHHPKKGTKNHLVYIYTGT